MPLISLSEQKDIALEITVTNQNGDPAHEASLIASFPRSLTYSAFRVGNNVSLSFCDTHSLFLPLTHTTCGSNWNLLLISGTASNL